MFLPSVFILSGERPRHSGSLHTVPGGAEALPRGSPPAPARPPPSSRWPAPAHCAHSTHCSLQTFYRNTHPADHDPHATPQPSCHELPALLEKGLVGSPPAPRERSPLLDPLLWLIPSHPLHAARDPLLRLACRTTVRLCPLPGHGHQLGGRHRCPTTSSPPARGVQRLLHLRP